MRDVLFMRDAQLKSQANSVIITAIIRTNLTTFPAFTRIYIASGKPTQNATSAKSTFQKVSISVYIIAYITSTVNICFNLIYQHKIP